MVTKGLPARLLLTFALPYLLLLAASLFSWPWRALGWPGVIGNLSPPSIALMGMVVYGAVLTMRGRLPLRLITWPPAGLGAVFFLTIGFGLGNLGSAAVPAAPIGYVVIFGFVLLISIALAQHSTALAVSFVCMFLMTQAIQLPVFEVSGAVTTSLKSGLTAISAIRASIEVGILIWLAHRLVSGPHETHNRWAIGLVFLVVVHGFLAGWELPVRLGNTVSFASYAAEVISWEFFAGLQIGIVTVIARLRQGWAKSLTEEPNLKPSKGKVIASERDPLRETNPPVISRFRSGKPTPRVRRRRR